ncbi:MAG: ribonuclease III [Neisseria sp.]|nr:ribonuclease III [Neisseria sp.]
MTTPQQNTALLHIQRGLNHNFRDPALLKRALTHRSHSAHNNERFEFIGDAILNYTVAKMLYEAFPDLPEGRLSRLRANLVNQKTLAEIAAGLHLGEALYLGTGELKSGGFGRPSILADAMEAVFAAVSFDADFAAAEQVIRRLFVQRLKNIDPAHEGKDAKSRLQEAMQAQRLPPPKYRIEHQQGEGNDARFTVSCDLGELGHITTARAASRRHAEQQAAQTALDWLNKHHPAKKTKP